MRDKTLDEHELATYSKELLATLAGMRLRFSLFTVSHEDLEGEIAITNYRSGVK